MTIQGTRYLWNLPAGSPHKARTLAADYNISMPVAQALVSRGFHTRDHLDGYLFPLIERDVHHPSLLADAAKAVARIRRALERGERILIFGDYDVDGMTATAMAVYCLIAVGANVNFYLPNRVTDGYGISARAVRRAASNGYSVIITVDNGISAFEAADEARQLGIDLIITDHHTPRGRLPDAYAIVDPARPDCPYPCKILAGVGVAFKVLALLYEELDRTLPDKVYELLALGTIADVVPLQDENRFWVRHGLGYINKAPGLAFSVLRGNSNITKEKLCSLDIGFSIAPQINALGRLSDPRRAIEFLIGSDRNVIEDVGRHLHVLNEARKSAERIIVADVEAAMRAKEIDVDHERIVMAAHSSWPVGVIGLAASRIVNLYGKPALLFHSSDDGNARGSGRSIDEFNLFAALQACSDIVGNFGGHAAAVGLSLPLSRLAVLKERLEDIIAKELAHADTERRITLDAQAQLPELTRTFMNDLAHLEPFGHGNEPLLFWIRNVVQVQQPVLLKNEHVKCHVFADGIVKPLIFFNRPDLFEVCLKLSDQPFDCAAHVSENCWKERVNIELHGIDIACHGCQGECP